MPRRLPQRTCLGCQNVRPKRDMIRIIRTRQGSVEIDPSGKKPGRGAYVCPSMDCLDKVRRGRRLEKALEVVPPPLIFELLKERIEEIKVLKGTESL